MTISYLRLVYVCGRFMFPTGLMGLRRSGAQGTTELRMDLAGVTQEVERKAA